MSKKQQGVYGSVILLALLIPFAHALTIDDLINSYDYSFSDGTLNITAVSDYILDTDSNGVNDTLIFNLTTNLTSGTYQAYVKLDDPNGLIIEGITKTLSGSSLFAINISTARLTKNQYNYSVRILDNSSYLLFENSGYQTKTYSGYDRGTSILNFSDANIANTHLQINLTLNITRNETVNATVSLAYNDSAISATEQVTLQEGVQTISIYFDNETIKSTHSSGRFIIDKVRLGKQLFEVNFSTAGYNYENFAQTSYIKTITHNFVDADADNLTDTLDLNFTIEVKSADDYTLLGALYDEENNFIAAINETANLSTGTRTMQTSINGSAIYRTYLDGSYVLSYVQLVELNVTRDTLTDAYTISDISYADFERPPLPDLVIEMQTTFNAQTNVSTVGLTISNVGPAAASNIAIDLFDNRTYENTSYISFLNAGASLNLSYALTNPSNSLMFVAIVDFDNLVDESDETNNVANNLILEGTPQITSLTSLPSPQGYGENVSIRAEITDVNGTQDIATVIVGIQPPQGNVTNYSMINISSNVWQRIYTDFKNGTYAYTVFVNDSSGLRSKSSGTFVITATLEMQINTTIIVQGNNQTVFLSWDAASGVSEDRTDYYRNGSVYVADGLSASDVGLNGTIPVNNAFTSTTGWMTSTVNDCKYNRSKAHKGNLSIMCENNADFKIYVMNSSFRGKIGSYVYFDSTGSSGNGAVGLLAVPTSGPQVGIQANPVTNSNVYCYEVGSCNVATTSVIWDQWVPIVLNFTATSIEFYYNGILLHRATTSGGLESFKFIAHDNGGTTRAYYDQIWMSSGDLPQAYPTQSTVTNNGTTNVSVFLLMKVQFWNGSSWLDNSVVLDDTSTRKIPSSQPIQALLVLERLYARMNGCKSFLPQESEGKVDKNWSFRVLNLFLQQDGYMPMARRRMAKK